MLRSFIEELIRLAKDKCLKRMATASQAIMDVGNLIRTISRLVSRCKGSNWESVKSFSDI